MTAPDRIWLQWSPEINDTDDVTWCKDKIHGDDVEYTRTYTPELMALINAAMEWHNARTPIFTAKASEMPPMFDRLAAAEKNLSAAIAAWEAK